MRIAGWAWAGALSLCAATGGAADAYRVDPAASEVLIQVGKAGLFKFAGHTHEVTAPVSEGRIVADAEDLSRSSVALTFQAAALRVSGKDEPPEDVPKVQEAMVGPKVLDAARFPQVAFTSRKVAGKPAGADAYELQVEGDLQLHGVTRPLTLPVRVEKAADGTLTATARATV
ncbi:MAG TPA: YceI family protein, partial [Vicinamibacteria bacterium]|nr:YceI family protein [Vicinamibacteria bacterium]